jgi:RNA polymerase sigma factor (sigma-70 family)
MTVQATRVEVEGDRKLIENCLSGDQDAWRALIRRYQRLVYSVANNLCPQSEDVSDVFQQVWLELFQRLAELRDRDALPAWIITVTRRKAYATIGKCVGEPLDFDISVASKNLTSIEEQHALERALEQLPERCRRLIDLLYFRIEEPSYSEIAKTMEMPVPSIGPTRARCLEKLRKLIR